MTTRPNNSNLTKAKREKNDEFYTQLTDIEKELRHYPDAFRDKVVLCNCDDQLESNFVKYFKTHFDELGLRGLLVNGYNRETGDGDFRSKECIELLKQADIVVTNPPFSLFREYVAQLVQYNKKFLIIGNMNAITYKEIFPLIKDGKIWLGVTHPKVFLRPDGSKKQVNACWFTNLDHGKRHEFLKLYKRYSKKEYQKYDNYNAIEVSKVKLIPMDYAGIMGVPITFLDKWNLEQFEIVGNEYTLDIDKGRGYIQGKRMYSRLFIRNKKPEA